MSTHWSRVAALIGVLAIVLGVTGAAAAQRPVTDDRLLNADKEGDNWLTFYRTYSGWRYSPLNQINVSNAGKLVAKWSLQLGELGEQQCTPLVNDGVMYVTTASLNRQRVYAVDAATGAVYWRWERRLPEDIDALARILPVNRGVALYGGNVVVGTLDAHLIALNAADGKQVWDVTVVDYKDGYHIAAAPLAVKGKIVVGMSGPGEMGNRGFVQAHDAATGNQLWRTYTIPGPGEPGNETWGGDSWKYGGGAVWLTGTYDPESNQLFYGVGNPAPWPNHVRPGANLWTDSSIALDADSGKFRWGVQHLANDPWDLDTPMENMVMEVDRGGRKIKAVVQANKLGHVFTMNRLEGQLVSAAPFAENMNIWKGAEPGTGKPIPNYDLKPTMGGAPVDICPAVFGASGWAFKSFNPNTGLKYIPAMDVCMRYTYEPEVKWTKGLLYIGAGFESYTTNPNGAGQLKAFDVNTNKVKWQWNTKGPLWGGGTVTTAGNLVFIGIAEGKLVAIDASNGNELWNFNVGTPLTGGTITYAVGGKQYVATVGGGVAESAAWAKDPSLAFMSTIPLGNVVMAFALSD
jgi:alcohol dehydrogenase (cytochrome c)